MLISITPRVRLSWWVWSPCGRWPAQREAFWPELLVSQYLFVVGWQLSLCQEQLLSLVPIFLLLFSFSFGSFSPRFFSLPLFSFYQFSLKTVVRESLSHWLFFGQLKTRRKHFSSPVVAVFIDINIVQETMNQKKNLDYLIIFSLFSVLQDMANICTRTLTLQPTFYNCLLHPPSGGKFPVTTRAHLTCPVAAGYTT